MTGTKRTWAGLARRSGPGSPGSTQWSSETCFSPTFVPIGSGCSRGSACGRCFRCGCAIPGRWRTNSSGWGTAPFSCAWTGRSSGASSPAGNSMSTCCTTFHKTWIPAGRTASFTRSYTRDWQRGSATPRTIDGRGSVFLVPLGQADAVAVDRLLGPCGPGALCVQPDYVLALATGSGATGVAIQDDSIAWIANPNLNTVTRLNYLSGGTTSVPVGVFPQAVAIVGTQVFVVNSNVVGSSPAGPSWLTSF